MRLLEVTSDVAATRDALCFSSWGSPLTVEQFQAREQMLRSQRWSRDVMQTWHWVDETGRVLSSCETFRMPSLVGAVEGVTFGVATVFTEQALRGRGAAKAMLEAVHARLSTEPGVQASILFSEIGEALYSPLGYVGVAPFDLLFEVNEATPKPASVRWGLETPLPSPGDSHALQVVMTEAQLAWHHSRPRFYASMLNRTVPSEWGASTDRGSIGWTANFRTNELEVLFIRGEAPALLEAAKWAAASVGLARVRMWETTPIEGCARVPRLNNLPMFRSFGAAFDRWAPIERALWV